MNSSLMILSTQAPRSGAQRGLSLVELMVALAIGLAILAAVLALFLNITRTNNELAKSNRQIENGRFAIQVLQSDLVHAGFWGAVRPAAATAIPDPCLAVGSWNDAYKVNRLAIPVQGFADGATLAGCGVSGVLANSDVLVVSHANTCIAGAAGCDGGTDTGPHIQVSGCTSAVPAEDPYRIDVPANLTLTEKNCTTTAEQRKLVTNIYYLATSNGQPTLMRVAFNNGAYSAPQPLVEGIEALRFEYGRDSDGNGSPDEYVSCEPCDQAQLQNIVAVKIHLLARNLEVTQGYTDSKTYQVGPDEFGPFNDNIKRHVFSTSVRLVNPSARREAP